MAGAGFTVTGSVEEAPVHDAFDPYTEIFPEVAEVEKATCIVAVPAPEIILQFAGTDQL
jgi:hypothetical protein